MQLRKFEPRQICFRGIRSDRQGWSLKLFSVIANKKAFDTEGFEPAVRMALDALPAPEPEKGRPGFGFLIAHQGYTENYLILGWWSNENELPVSVWVSRENETWRPSTEAESFCVWDLEIMWEERQAWISTMMSGPARPEEYLALVPAQFERIAA